MKRRGITTAEATLSLETRGKVSAVIQRPGTEAEAVETGIILAHGAGNDMHSPLLAFFAERLAGAGYTVLRFNFPYKEKGGKAPDPRPVLEETWRAAIGCLRGWDARPLRAIIAGGKSMGGRVAAEMAAAGSLGPDGLVFLGYPLHPPGKKDRLRDGPLYRIRVPMLFLSGTRDPLCDLALLRGVLNGVSAPWALEVIRDGDHSFRVKKSTGLSQEEVYADAVRRTAAWLRSAFGS
jgi:predicted alpha/beta-hydrolase family hydrolase